MTSNLTLIMIMSNDGDVVGDEGVVGDDDGVVDDDSEYVEKRDLPSSINFLPSPQLFQDRAVVLDLLQVMKLRRGSVPL